jgi:hypothetical protein
MIDKHFYSLLSVSATPSHSSYKKEKSVHLTKIFRSKYSLRTLNISSENFSRRRNATFRRILIGAIVFGLLGIIIFPLLSPGTTSPQPPKDETNGGDDATTLPISKVKIEASMNYTIFFIFQGEIMFIEISLQEILSRNTCI